MYKWVTGTAVASGLLLYFFFDARSIAFPRCPFHVITGLYCPGCGSQRALSSFLHGDWAQAFRYNSLLPIFLPVFLYSGFAALRNTGTASVSLFYKPVFVRAVLLGVLLFWILRNLPFYPFSLLAPTE